MSKNLIYPMSFNPQQKTLVLGYAPEFCQTNTFFLSVLPIPNAKQINYEAQTEEGVSALLASWFCSNHNTFQHLDLGYLSAETNIGEEEFQEINDFLDNQPFGILITQDFIKHPAFCNILSYLTLINQHTSANLYFHTSTPLTPEDLPESNGMMAYLTQGDNSLEVSALFATLAKIKHQQEVQVLIAQTTYTLKVNLDSSLKNSIAIAKIPNPPNDLYPYQRIKLIKNEE